MRITRAARVLLLAFALPAFGWAAGSVLRPVPALAACGDSPGEPDALFYFNPPQVNYQITGAAPFAVSATFAMDVVVPAGSTASLNWGDGTGSTPFAVQDCGDGDINWGMVSYSHTYASPGSYTIHWTFSLVGYGTTVPIAIVNVQSAAAPTPVPTPAPAPTAVPTPTAAATAAAPTATPPAAATPVPVQATESPTALPSPSVTTTAPPTATPTATATPTTAATPTVVAAASTSAPPPPPSTPAAKEPDLPEVLADVPTIGDIDTAPATLATNLALAGVTVWVLFSSVLVNQVLQDNRSEIDARTARLARPLRKLTGERRRALPGGRWLAAATVLAFTGLIYGFLDPHFGVNEASALLFLSAVLGVGLVTYTTSGLEALRTRKVHGVAAAVRPFPASIVLAVISVALSRLLDLQPGVMYGFVASCAITGPGVVDERRAGSVAIYPVLAGLGLSILALVAVEPLRANSGVATSFLGQLLIGAGIVVFIGGIEGVAINMLPLAVTDGGKLYGWHRTVWAVIALVSAFLAWEVLLNRNRNSFDALRPANSMTMLIVFVAYTALSLGLWAYFKVRKEPPPLPEGELTPPL